MKLVQSQITPIIALTYINPALNIIYLNPVASVIIDERGLNKYARDDVNEVDLLSIAFGKFIEDSQSTVDQVIFGIGKNIINDPAYTEDLLSLSIGFNRLFADSYSTSDQILSFAISKKLSDAFVTSDLISGMVMSKALTDVAITVDIADINAGDGLEYAFGKGINDTPINASDAYYTLVEKGLTESSTLSDAINRLVIDKVLSDASISNDTLTSDITKPLTDSYTSTDLLDRVFDSIRDFTETLTSADSINSFAIGKALNESAGSTEAGSLRMTDYADITYFAEDYVGSSRTF
jgi:hypothetical protein